MMITKSSPTDEAASGCTATPSKFGEVRPLRFERSTVE